MLILFSHNTQKNYLVTPTVEISDINAGHWSVKSPREFYFSMTSRRRRTRRDATRDVIAPLLLSPYPRAAETIHLRRASVPDLRSVVH